MTSDRTRDVLEQLTVTRRRVDELRKTWDAHHDVAEVVAELDELSAGSAAFPSIEALFFGAARLIEGSEPAGHRLEKLSDHLHGYMVGWEDASQ